MEEEDAWNTGPSIEDIITSVLKTKTTSKFGSRLKARLSQSARRDPSTTTDGVPRQRTEELRSWDKNGSGGGGGVRVDSGSMNRQDLQTKDHPHQDHVPLSASKLKKHSISTPELRSKFMDPASYKNADENSKANRRVDFSKWSVSSGSLANKENTAPNRDSSVIGAPNKDCSAISSASYHRSDGRSGREMLEPVEKYWDEYDTLKHTGVLSSKHTEELKENMFRVPVSRDPGLGHAVKRSALAEVSRHGNISHVQREDVFDSFNIHQHEKMETPVRHNVLGEQGRLGAHSQRSLITHVSGEGKPLYSYPDIRTMGNTFTKELPSPHIHSVSHTIGYKTAEQHQQKMAEHNCRTAEAHHKTVEWLHKTTEAQHNVPVDRLPLEPVLTRVSPPVPSSNIPTSPQLSTATHSAPLCKTVEEYDRSLDLSHNAMLTDSQQHSATLTGSQQYNRSINTSQISKTLTQQGSASLTGQHFSRSLTNSQIKSAVLDKQHPSSQHQTGSQASNSNTAPRQLPKSTASNLPASHNAHLQIQTPSHPQLQPQPPTQPSTHKLQNKDMITVKGKEYFKLLLLGRGGSSKVYEAIDFEERRVVAVKVVDLEGVDDATRALYKNEIAILQRLQWSTRVIKLYDYEERGNQLSLVLEKGNGDLASVLSSVRGKNGSTTTTITPFTIQHYWHGMLQAVQAIHKEGIIHSDLKPANFLLVKDAVKLIDFGIASSIQQDMTSVVKDSQGGTFSYMSPESLRDIHSGPIVNSRSGGNLTIKIGVKSDVWSLGCILYNLVYGYTPFHHIKNPLEKLKAISLESTRISFPEIEDKHLMDVLKRCLRFNPRERPTIEELLDHPYLTQREHGHLEHEQGQQESSKRQQQQLKGQKEQYEQGRKEDSKGQQENLKVVQEHLKRQQEPIKEQKEHMKVQQKSQQAPEVQEKERSQVKSNIEPSLKLVMDQFAHLSPDSLKKISLHDLLVMQKVNADGKPV